MWCPQPANAATFRDVPSGEWYATWVKQASDKGLMSGFTDASGRPTGYFGPDEPLTRAQVATVLWRMAGSPSSGHASFPDVVKGSWYDQAVAWCVRAGVVTGYTSGADKGCFRPDRPVSRQELATMAYRYAKHAGMDTSNPDPSSFKATTDWRSVDSWAVEALTWTSAAGVLSGVDNHDGTRSIQPFGTATRAMAAKVFVVLSGSPVPAKASVTVAFNSNGGSSIKAQSVKPGSKASKPANPTKAGYTFKGWFSDKGLTKAYDFNSAVKANLTLYAKWDINKYTVTFDSNGGSSVAKQTVAYGSKASKPANPTRSGHAFKGWYTDKALTKAYDFSSAVKGNLTLYAKWDVNKYTVTFDSNGGSSVATQTMAYGSKASKPASPTKTGYTFKGWYSDKALTKAYDFSSAVKGNLTLYAKWEPTGTAAYALLYKDGLLSLQLGDAADPSHGDVLYKWEWDGSSRPWYDKRARVRSVTVGKGVVAKGCSGLFEDLVNCKTMDLGNLDVSDVSDFSQMFFGCSSLTSLDLSTWDVSEATYFSGMFASCKSLRSLDVSKWDTSSVSDFSNMFSGCSSLVSLSISGWDTSSVTNLFDMFMDCSSLTSLDLSDWDTSNVTNFIQMFSGCSSLGHLDLSGWDVSNASDNPFYGMLRSCLSLTELDVSDWNTANVRDLSSIFSGYSALTSLDLSTWDVSNVEDFSEMFRDCSALQTLDLSGWEVSSASNFNATFSGCSSLSSLSVSSWDVSGAKDFSCMFWDCASLASLDLSGWDTSSAGDCYFLFGNSYSISSVTVGAAFTLGSAMPYGPWYDASGESYKTFPNNVAGTFTRNVAGQALEAGEQPVVEAPAAVPAAPEGLLYTVVPEGSSYEPGVEYAELGGRYVGPGAYVTGYAGEAGSLVLPLAVEGVPVVSANLSWNDSDRAGMTRLSSLAFERSDGTPSSLVQLDVTGDNLASLDLAGLDALVRLSCAGNPIADLSQLRAWAAVESHEGTLPEQPAANDAGLPSDAEDGGDFADGNGASEPAQPVEPAEPGESSTPGDVGGDDLDAPADPAQSPDLSGEGQPDEDATTGGISNNEPATDASSTGAPSGQVPSESLEPAGEGGMPLELAA